MRYLRNDPQIADNASPVAGTALFAMLLPGLISCGSQSTSPVAATDAITYAAPNIPGTAVIQPLFTSDLTGGHVMQLTDDGLDVFLPHFSPDGQHIVYSKFFYGRYGEPGFLSDIVVYDIASGTERRLTNTGQDIQPAWSPDGSQIAYGNEAGNALYLMNADGSNQRLLAAPNGADDDQQWHDFAWSSDNWIMFVVAQDLNGCFKARVDKIRPDGSSRTQVTDGGTNCTPPNMEPYGDADPGFSADGQTIYSSRGLAPLPADPSRTLRHLYAFSSGAYFPGKPETDLSVPAHQDCIVGVPKASPKSNQVLVYLYCPDDAQHAGVTLTDSTASSWTYINNGFGADWNLALAN